MKGSFSLSLILGLLLPALASAQIPAGQPVPPAATVAVLNFANLGQGDGAWDWLGKGLADLTIGDLVGQGLKVVSREQMQELVRELRLKRQQQDPRSVALVLKAQHCVHGTFRVAGGKVELHVVLLEVASGKQVHAAAVAGKEAEVLKLQKKLAAQLADVLKGNKAGTSDPARLPQWTESVPASQLLYQGIDEFDRGEYLSAWGLFRRALRQDAGYADARYWSGRMLYYVQEYHQARIDLERFAVAHPQHPRAGDAVMEIISAVQLTAVDASEVLQILAWAARLAPTAPIAGSSSSVGLYATGLGAEILRDQHRPREAFDRYWELLPHFPKNHHFYALAWREMFKLKLQHLKETGHLLSMPERYIPSKPPQKPAPNPFDDDPTKEPVFHVFTADNNTFEYDFSKQPFSLDGQFIRTLPLLYFAADPGHFLTELEIKVRYRPDPVHDCAFKLKGDVPEILGTGMGQKAAERTYEKVCRLKPGTRVVGLQLELNVFGILSFVDKNKKPPSAAILSWQITARLRPVAAPGSTLIVRAPREWNLPIRVNGFAYPLLNGQAVIPHLPPGTYTIGFHPFSWQIAQSYKEIRCTIAPGDSVELALFTNVPPRSQRGYGKQIASYELFRMGGELGEATGTRPGMVRFCLDRSGRWIVLWSCRRHLYLTTSTDHGFSWTPAVQLAPPVNSAHEEKLPFLCQDADGRFLLAFSSDRGADHKPALYVCWSDDLVYFSAPIRVTNEADSVLRLLQREDGSYLLFFYLRGHGPGQAIPSRATLQPPYFPHFAKAKPAEDRPRWAVSSSKDLVHWSLPQPVILPFEGKLEEPKTVDFIADAGQILALSYDDKAGFQIRTSVDGLRFSQPTPLRWAAGPKTPMGSNRDKMGNIIPTYLVCGRQNGNLVAMGSSFAGRGTFLRRLKDGTWKRHSLESVATIAHLWGDFGLMEYELYFFSLPRQDAGPILLPDPLSAPVLTDTPTLQMYQKAYKNPIIPGPPPNWQLPSEVVTQVVGASELPVLRAQLTGKSLERKRQAAWKLAMVDRDIEVVIPILSDWLGDLSASERHRAALALAKLGPRAQKVLPVLVEAVRDKDAALRLQALWSLFTVGADPDTWRRALSVCRKDPDARVRHTAVLMMLDLDEEALPYLAEAMKDQDPTVRQLADIVVASMQPDPQKALAAGIGKNANTAAWSLEQIITSPDQIPLLGQLLKDPSEERVEAALQNLQRFGPQAKSEMKGIEAALSHKNAKVRAAAAGVLFKIGPEAKATAQALNAAVHDKDPQVRLQALAALNMVDQEGAYAVSAALAGLQDSSPDCVFVARNALEKFGKTEMALPILEKRIKDPNPQIRAAVLRVLRSFGKRAETLAALVLEAALDPDAEVRSCAAFAMPGTCQPEKAFPILMTLVKDKHPTVRNGAAWGLAGMGPRAKDAIPVLTELLKDPDGQVRLSAQFCLKYLQGKR